MQEVLLEYIEQHMALSDEEKNAIGSTDVFHTFKKGDILLKKGDITNDSIFVLKGCIRIYYVIEGEEKTTSFYTEMEGVTPECAINNKPSEYYIATVEDTIASISGPELENEMFKKFPRFETLCRILSEKLLSKKQVDLDLFKTSSPEQRYLNLLEQRPDLIQRVPQHQLASYLGIKPQSLSRLKARLYKNRS